MTCANPGHNHVNFYTDDGVLLQEPTPQVCRGCGASCYWDVASQRYQHTDASVPDCGHVQYHGDRTACQNEQVTWQREWYHLQWFHQPSSRWMFGSYVSDGLLHNAPFATLEPALAELRRNQQRASELGHSPWLRVLYEVRTYTIVEST